MFPLPVLVAGEGLWHFTEIPSPLLKMKASWWPLLRYAYADMLHGWRRLALRGKAEKGLCYWAGGRPTQILLALLVSNSRYFTPAEVSSLCSNCFGFGKAFQNRFALRPRACGSSWPSVPGHRFREFHLDIASMFLFFYIFVLSLYIYIYLYNMYVW